MLCDDLRAPPSSVQAEQAVLGGLMVSPKGLWKVQDILDSEDFYRRDHQLIFRAICELSEKKQPFDAVTLCDWFAAKGLLEEVEGGEYLIHLANNTPGAANIKAYAEIVHDKALLRRLVDAGTAIASNGYAPDGRATEDLLAAAQQSIIDLQPRQRGGLQLASDGLGEWLDDLQQRYDRGGGMMGAPYPWHELNKKTGGMEKATLILLPARPNMGKSVASNNIGMFSALRGMNVAQFSLEASRDQINRRNIAALGGVPYRWLQTPDRDDPDQGIWLNRIRDAMAQLKGKKLYVDATPDLTIGQLQARARMLHMQEPLDLVIVDHIHDMKIKASEARFELGKIAQGLKTLAKEFNCPVIAAAQLNRGNATRADKRPTMTDLRESGELEQKADVILFLHREDYYDANALPGVVEVIVAKGRDIQSGQTIHLRNDFSHMALRDWEGPLPTNKPIDKSEKKLNRWGQVERELQ